MTILNATPNRHGGICVSPEDLLQHKKSFAVSLQTSIVEWKKLGFKVVWVKVPNVLVHELARLYELGFENHHCDKEGITLTKRLIEGTLVPHYANHTIGMGGLVINDNNELLTIREIGNMKTMPNNWKFPGGMLDPYEHMADGAMREVFEETGIRTEFENFIGFRHHHLGQFSTSNIYAVCRLKPLNLDITIQEDEIFDAKWFPIDEYLADETIGKYNQLIVKAALEKQGLESVDIPNYMKKPEQYEIFM